VSSADFFASRTLIQHPTPLIQLALCLNWAPVAAIILYVIKPQVVSRDGILSTWVVGPCMDTFS
jgi:hypothetical protein